MIQQKLEPSERIELLNQTAIQQMHLLTDENAIKKLESGKS
jgi:hypothetical protein